MAPIMVGLGVHPLEFATQVFYFLCALIGLFCVIALGFGPLFFVLVGAVLAVLAFRQRFRRWWGLPLAAAGLGLVLSVALGWPWRHVVLAFVVSFVLLTVARIAGRAADRRSEPLRR
jgi:lysylphosphatidylglycerol synthetase-like protein (DUF2156 family)